MYIIIYNYIVFINKFDTYYAYAFELNNKQADKCKFLHFKGEPYEGSYKLKFFPIT